MIRPPLPLLARLLFAGASGFAYVCALLPGDPSIVASDKGNHAIAFATLGLLARLGWPSARWWVLVVVLAAFGGAIELSQALPFIHRDASWADLGADIVATLGGVLLGAAMLAMLGRPR